MGDKLDKIVSDLKEAVTASQEKKTTAYDTTATVTRIEGSTAWVHIPGGIDETPVKLTVNAQAGDTVQVRVSGGKAWITGNASAPPTDDTTAVRASATATKATAVAEQAQQTAEGVSATASNANAKANEAIKIAGDTSQYFWHTDTGDDTGAHITEITQDEFVADPENGGGNTLIRSNGVAIRDGLDELATFSGEGAVIGQNGVTSTVKIASDGLTQEGANGMHLMDIKSDGDTESITLKWQPYTAQAEADLDVKPDGTFTIYYSIDSSGGSTTLTGGTASSKTVSPTLYPDKTATLTYDGNKHLEITSSYTCNMSQINYAADTNSTYATIGYRTGTNYPYSMTFGAGLKASKKYQTVIGKYNAGYQSAFEIGAGNSVNDTRDALYIRDDGDTYMYIDEESSDTNDTSLINALKGAGIYNGTVLESSHYLDIKMLLAKLSIDFVTIERTSGNWKIRQWASGKVEQWYRLNNGGLTIATQVGSVYQTASNVSLTYPVALSSIDNVQVSVANNNYSVWAVVYAANTTQCSYRAMSAASRAQANTYNISAYVVGTV